MAQLSKWRNGERMGRRQLEAWLAVIGGLTVICLPMLGAEKPIGDRAPEWEVTHWLNSPPLALKDVRDKVVLVRWWTAPDCPYCEATAPALNGFTRVATGKDGRSLPLSSQVGRAVASE